MTTATSAERALAPFGAAVIAGLNGADVRDARALWASLRAAVGYRRAPAPLLTSGAAQQKLGKNTLPSFGLMLIPERGMMAPELADVRAAFGLRGAVNLCPRASKGCAAACLSRSGQSGMPSAQRAQAVRTAFLLSHPAAAGLLVGAELAAALARHGGRINLRLNTTSDIRWEVIAPAMVDALAAAGVLLYDYTAWAPADRAPSTAYALTYSAKEPSHTSDDYLAAILAAGDNVAMPFDTPRGAALPRTWRGYRVIDGDKSDERRDDPRGVVVGLRAKGHEWRRDNTAGFIRRAHPALLPLSVVAR